MFNKIIRIFATIGSTVILSSNVLAADISIPSSASLKVTFSELLQITSPGHKRAIVGTKSDTLFCALSMIGHQASSSATCEVSRTGDNWELRGELGKGGVLACRAMCVKK